MPLNSESFVSLLTKPVAPFNKTHFGMTLFYFFRGSTYDDNKEEQTGSLSAALQNRPQTQQNPYSDLSEWLTQTDSVSNVLAQVPYSELCRALVDVKSIILS